MVEWSISWKSSKNQTKQRKYRLHAPLHIRQKFVGCHLSAELREKYGKRAMPVRQGDKVKVMKGTFKNHSGKVDRVDLKHSKVYITGIELNKKDGSKVTPPMEPSNLIITNLDMSDKRRENSNKARDKK